MAQVKLGFSEMTIPEKIQAAKNIVAQMTGNANYPAPTPALATVAAAAADLETAFEAAVDGGTSKTALMHTQEKALVLLMAQLTAYVQVASGGDANIILTSGMKVRASKTPPQALLAPVGLLATIGKSEGEVTLKWKPLDGAVAYAAEQSADGNTNWTATGNSTKSNITVNGLTSGSKMYFRVAGIGAKGQGPWSAPARGMAG